MHFNELAAMSQDCSYNSPTYSPHIFSSVFDTFTERDAEAFLSFAIACGPHPELKTELFGNTLCPIPGCKCGNEVPTKFAVGRKCKDGAITGETLDQIRHSISTLWQGQRGKHAQAYEEGLEDDMGNVVVVGDPWSSKLVEHFCHSKEKMDASEGLIREQADAATFQQMLMYEAHFIQNILPATDDQIKVPMYPNSPKNVYTLASP